MSAGAPSDEELWQRLQGGDAAAFDALFERHSRPVHKQLCRLVRGATAADDLLQEVFLRVWKGSAPWERRGPLEAWLLRMATNLALNHLRDTRRLRQQPLEGSADSADEEDATATPDWLLDASALGPDELAAQAEESAALHALIAGLPEAQRRALELAQDGRLRTEEIAERLGVPPGTVKSRLHAARGQLAREWTRRHPEGEPR